MPPKPRFDFYSLGACDHLNKWVAAPKRFSETLVFQPAQNGFGSSQEVELEVQGYHASNAFSMMLVERNARFYLEFFATEGHDRNWIYQLGAAHPQTDRVYHDACCNADVVKDRGYEKRQAATCFKDRGRRTIEALTAGQLEAFFEAGCEFLSVTSPENPLVRVSQLPTLGAIR